MNAKEKAKQLVEKYQNSIKDQTGYFMLGQYSAKQCAIIAVENEKNALIKFSEYWNIQKGEWHRDELNKIEQVKTEIQNL